MNLNGVYSRMDIASSMMWERPNGRATNFSQIRNYVCLFSIENMHSIQTVAAKYTCSIVPRSSRNAVFNIAQHNAFSYSCKSQSPSHSPSFLVLLNDALASFPYTHTERAQHAAKYLHCFARAHLPESICLHM